MVVGNKVIIKVVKNKVAPPLRSTVVDVMFGEGISTLDEILDLSVERNLIQKSGCFYSYNDERVGQGRDKAKQWLKSHPEIVDSLEYKIRTDSCYDL